MHKLSFVKYATMTTNGSAMVRCDSVCVGSWRIGALVSGFFHLDSKRSLKIRIFHLGNPCLPLAGVEINYTP